MTLCHILPEWRGWVNSTIRKLWLVLLIFSKLVSILQNWGGSGKVYCGHYHFSIVAILCEGIYWFGVSGQYMESWICREFRSKADLAAETALSFHLTPMWLGIQHIIISLLFDIESSLLNSLTIRGFSSFLLLTESKSENMINF